MRGDVHRYKGTRNAAGREQGHRLAVVLQSDGVPLSTWVIAPTSVSARPGLIRPTVVVDGQETLVMTDQIIAVDPEARLGDLVGHLSHAEMTAVDRALRLVLALD